MVPTNNNKYKHEGCTKQPSFDIVGNIRPSSCARHAAEGMIDVMRRQCSRASQSGRHSASLAVGGLRSLALSMSQRRWLLSIPRYAGMRTAQSTHHSASMTARRRSFVLSMLQREWLMLSARDVSKRVARSTRHGVLLEETYVLRSACRRGDSRY